MDIIFGGAGYLYAAVTATKVLSGGDFFPSLLDYVLKKSLDLNSSSKLQRSNFVCPLKPNTK